MPCYFLLFPHHRCIPLIIAASKNVLITVCVRRHCQPREANIPDRVHYACDVNEVCARHVPAVCHQRAGKQGRWVRVLWFPSTVSTNEKKFFFSRLTLIGTNLKYFHLKYIWGRAFYLLSFVRKNKRFVISTFRNWILKCSELIIGHNMKAMTASALFLKNSEISLQFFVSATI